MRGDHEEYTEKLREEIKDLNDEYKEELGTVKTIVESVRMEVAVIHKVMEGLDKTLFGNGQPGIVEKMQNKLASHDKLIWIGIGVIAAMNFLSGSGIISLKNLLGK